MIDLDFIEGLIRAIDQSGLDSIEIERGGTRIRMAKSPSGSVVAAPAMVTSAPAAPVVAAAPAPAAAPEQPAAAPEDLPPEASNLVEITSPMVGTFYRAPSPDAPPYVQVGSRVGTGDTLCIIEAMKLMNELEAEMSGTIAEVLVENAEPVEYGQPLFRIEPA
jgi:acetyl-CoA carboxylase biotin carboxyl carrier protein